jgi:hypothetical protein
METTTEVKETIQESLPAQEPVVEGQQAVETTEPLEQSTEETTTEEQNAFLFKGKFGEEELTWDASTPEGRQKLIDDAQKGIAFSKKSDALTAFETQNKQKLDAYNQIVGNETLMKILAAQQLGVDPTVLFQTPQPPDPALRETYPEYYIQEYNKYDMATRQKQAAEQHWNTMKAQQSSYQNSSNLQRAKMEHDLTDEQAGQLQKFITSGYFQPNQLGIYSDDQFAMAAYQLFGRQKMGQQQLDQATQIQKNIKKISSTHPVSTAKTQTPAEEQQAKSYLELVRERVALREKRK